MQLVISTYQLNDVLYPLAYQALQKRYNTKRRLAQLHVDKIFNFTKLAMNNLENLEIFLNVHTTAVNSFKALNITDHLDCVILYIPVRNLDSSIRKAFENKVHLKIFQLFNRLLNSSTKLVKLKN